MKEDEASLARKQEYYERLLAIDVFAEEDYAELARIYGSRGDWKEQRRMLFKLLRLYPSEEYAEQLSAVTVYRDDTEEDMVILAGADILQVSTGGLDVEITWHDGQGRFLFYQGDETGAVLGSATLVDEAYTGVVKVVYSDGEGNVTKSLQGTLENGVCVGELTVVYQGVEYSGTFQEDGTTAEEQVKEVTDQGGVLYAYGPGGRTYLYQENVEIADFRIGPAFFGLPEYVEWR